MTTQNRRAFLKHSVAVALGSSAMFAPLLTTAGQAQATQAADSSLRAFLKSGSRTVSGITLRHKDKLARIYSERGYVPMWSTDGHYTNTSRAVVNKLENSSLLGLHPSHYYTQVINSWLHLQEPRSSTRLELLLTDSLYEYFDNLANGQTGEKPGDDIDGGITPPCEFFTGTIFIDSNLIINAIQTFWQHYRNITNFFPQAASNT